MLHAPFSDYTDPLTGKARMMTRCGDDLPADSERLLSDWDLAKLSDREGEDVCADCLPSAIQLVAVKSLAASFEITSSLHGGRPFWPWASKPKRPASKGPSATCWQSLRRTPRRCVSPV